MMTIDLERLAVDADYWCAVAPYGASHLIDGDRFVKWVNGAEYELYPYDDENNWEPANCSYSLSEYFQGTMWKVIARPMHWPAPKSHPTDTQPAESGAQISVKWGGMPIQAQYSAILPDSTLVFYRKDSCGTWQIWGFHSKQWLFDGYANDAGKPPYNLKAIRSQAEREREPVIIAALRAADPPADDEIHPRQYLIDSLNILYAAGMLRMPGEDVAKNARGES
jgi:hypothetical protein